LELACSASLPLLRSAWPAGSVAFAAAAAAPTCGARAPRMTGSSGPEALADWAEPPQAQMAAPRRGARRQAYWPGARMLRSAGEHV
jgi:hypothetical protein